MNSSALLLLATVAVPVLRSGCDERKVDLVQHDAMGSQTSGQPYAAVCKVGERGGDGTLIGPYWVLTAAHVAEGIHKRDGGKVQVRFDNGTIVDVKHVFLHPQYQPMGHHDLALLQLSAPIRNVTPLSIYTGDGELHQMIILAGHGDRRQPDGSWIKDGKLRSFTNQIDAVNATSIIFDYDRPGPDATENEGTSGPGDSGGPALIGTDSGLVVIGVSSMGEPGEDGPCSYGAIEHFVRVSRFVPWIEGVMRMPDAHVPLGSMEGDTRDGGAVEMDTSSRGSGSLGGSMREQAAQRIVDALASGERMRLEEVVATTYDPGIISKRDAATIVRNMPALVRELSGARLRRVLRIDDRRISLEMENTEKVYGLDLFFNASGMIEQMAFGRTE